jgi:hypothetical protein
MCILGSLHAIHCHWKRVKCKQFQKNSNTAQMQTRDNFMWRIINVKIKQKRNENKTKNIKIKQRKNKKEIGQNKMHKKHKRKTQPMT